MSDSRAPQAKGKSSDAASTVIVHKKTEVGSGSTASTRRVEPVSCYYVSFGDPSHSQIPETTAFPRRLGEFTIEKELGRGGMGVVYQAWDHVTERHVALKLLHAGAFREHSDFERFRREILAMAAVNHPNCVYLYGVHQIDGAPAFSMELVVGGTLAEFGKKGRATPMSRIVRWALQIIEGIEAAHSVGILHRDIKPSNCLLTADGRVKIADFGLSRLVQPASTLTKEGSYLGTPVFSSPEQVRGRELDHRSDIYSIGATLYTLLTGEAPFGGSTSNEVLARVLAEEPPAPRSIRKRIPIALEAVVQRAMAKEPSARFQTLSEFRRVLQPFALDRTLISDLWTRRLALELDSYVILVAFLGFSSAVSIPTRISGQPFGLVISIAELFFIRVAYFALFEGLSGATLGKRILSLRVIRLGTQGPSVARAAVRAGVFWFSDVATCAAPWLLRGVSPSTQVFLISVFPWAGMLTNCTTMREHNGYRGLHEFVSGTMVLPESSTESRPLLIPTIPMRPRPAPSREASAPLHGLEILEVLGESPAGVWKSAFDHSVDRHVWVHERSIDAIPELRADSRTSSPHEIRLQRTEVFESSRFEVYEDPCALLVIDLATGVRRYDWATAFEFLIRLADALRSYPEPIRVDQILVDRYGSVRFAPHPLRARDSHTTDRMGVFREAARQILLGHDRDRKRGPCDMPVAAESTISKLLEEGKIDENIDETWRDLIRLRALPQRIGARVRFFHLLSAGVFSFSYLVFIPLTIDPLLALIPIEKVPGTSKTLARITVLAVPLFLAFMFRGGPSFSALRIALRSRSGLRTSRWHCALRSLVAWGIPVLATAALVSSGAGRLINNTVPTWALLWGIVVAGLVSAVLALRHPGRGIADIIVGTHLVPNSRPPERPSFGRTRMPRSRSGTKPRSVG